MSIIQNFELDVLARDAYKCVICGANSKSVHIITSSIKVLSNGITLCANHLEIALKQNNEFYHDELYEMIGSSYEKFRKEESFMKK